MAALSLVPAPSSLMDRVREVEQIASLVEALDESEDVEPIFREQMSRDLIEAITGTKDKVDRTAAVLAQYQAAADSAEAEAARMRTRSQWFERQHERLCEYVLAVLRASNLKQLDGRTCTLVARKNPESVVVDDAEVLPIQYMRQPPPPPMQPDKVVIKTALQAGEEVPGCRLVRKMRLEVK